MIFATVASERMSFLLQKCVLEKQEISCAVSPSGLLFSAPCLGGESSKASTVLLRGRKKRERELAAATANQLRTTEAAVEIFAAASSASSLKLGLPL